MRHSVALIASLSLAGCVTGIPDADPPVAKLKPCARIVIIQPANRAYCMTDVEFDRWVRRNLPQQD